jgi:hypothetical protein
MDNATAVPKRTRLNPHGKALRRQRIFARLRMGFAYCDIAREEGVTPRRIRQIVSEALQRQKADSDSDRAILQRARSRRRSGSRPTGSAPAERGRVGRVCAQPLEKSRFVEAKRF